MKQAKVHQAKAHFSALLRQVEQGETIEIYRGQTPVARLQPIAKPGKRQFGGARGLGYIADDFNAPLPEELLREFDK